MITFEDIKSNPYITEYIQQTQDYMAWLGFTDHGFKHVAIVAERAQALAQAVKLPKRQQELSAMAGWCHDMANFLGRTQHHYWAGIMFHETFRDKMTPRDLAVVTQAIVAHDKDEIKIPSKIAACLIIADKSDVRRSRVINPSPANLKKDIHDRLNYAVTDNQLKIDAKNKIVTLKLIIDVNRAPLMEYFQIFSERMAYCRKAAEVLGWRFGIVINHVKLL
ncbi:phosphohydrolase [Patescibacteria group bacterium]|nr:phosphohydrolase [Patescibacteria group bacterium]